VTFGPRDWSPVIKACQCCGILSVIESHPWSGEYLRNAQKLALLLRPLLIRPKTIRFEDNFYKGYLRQWFEEALRRLPHYDGNLG
jgi:hypothetical protein